MTEMKARTGKAARKKALANKAVAKKAAAAHILSAPRGARTLTHRQIKRAVEKVFEERYGIDA